MMDLFTRCGSDAEFLQVIKGSALVKKGTPTYSPGAFGGDGQNIDGSNNWRFNFSQGLCSITFKYIPSYNYNDGLNHSIFEDQDFGGYGSLQKISSNLLQIILWNFPTGTTYSFYRITPNAWASGDEISFCILANTGESAGNKIKIYQNNILLTNNSVIADDDFSGNLFFNIGGSNSGNGVIDNIKTYSHLLLSNERLNDMRSERGNLRDWIG